MKKIIILILIIGTLFLVSCKPNNTVHKHSYVDGICDCGEVDEVWVASNFDVNEEKIYYNDKELPNILYDTLIIVLKRSKTYPQLTLRHFPFSRVLDIELLFESPVRPSNYSDSDWEKYLYTFHQMVILTIDAKNYEEMIFILREVEKLPYVLSVEPDIVESLID